MPIITASIDPITRIEGHLRVDVKIGTVAGQQQVVDAACIGTLYRGFEKIMENRDPRDAVIITSRICGVCPTAHSMTAALALDLAAGVRPPTNGRLLRNLVHGSCFLESHLLHFYLLSLPDYIPLPGMPPWSPNWETGRRHDATVLARLQNHYLQAIAMRRKAHEMGAIFGGKLPHTPGFIAGGFTAVPTASDRSAFGALLTELVAFIESTYLPDVEVLAGIYPDYFTIGRGHGHLLAFGDFWMDDAYTAKLFGPGRIANAQGTTLAVDTTRIAEDVTRSWYANATNNRHPAVGLTVPENPKPGAYTWLKAPRYDGAPMECGPLARLFVSGDYTNGVSVLDRHRARAMEALKLARAMQSWLADLTDDATGYTPYTVPVSTAQPAAGLAEAPRGALGHWLGIADSKVSQYQIITPTCWNVSPRDAAGVRGPLEQALVGTPIANADEPVEALRVIHSIDPCLDCATHVMRADGETRVFALGAAPGRVQTA